MKSLSRLALTSSCLLALVACGGSQGATSQPTAASEVITRPAQPLIDLSTPPPPGGRSAAALQEAMAEVMAARALPPASLPQRLLLAWSAVHGFAMLVIEGQCQDFFGIGSDQPRQARTAADAVLALLQGALAGPG